MTENPDYVYLDYAATTPVDPRVADRMRSVQAENFANASSSHVFGRQSADLVQKAAQQLGHLLNMNPESFIWTSGATESNNLAIFGAAKIRAHRGRHLVTMRTEHKAVVDVFRELEALDFDVTWLAPGADGRVSVHDLENALRDDTQLVSIMHVNNETGIDQDIAALGECCRNRGVVFHVDAAQSVGKMRIDLDEMPVDLLSLTAHKFYGPKGIGALYIGDNVSVAPLMFGGGQQRRLRPGTLPVELIVGLGEAAGIAAQQSNNELSSIRALCERLWTGLKDIDGVTINGDPESGYPGILNVSVEDIEGESLLLALEPLCVATGSACNSTANEPSYVLRALGRSDLEAQSAIRFSLGRHTTSDDIDCAISTYRGAVAKLRGLAP